MERKAEGPVCEKVTLEWDEHLFERLHFSINTDVYNDEIKMSIEAALEEEV